MISLEKYYCACCSNEEKRMYKIYTETKQRIARWNSLELAKKHAHIYASTHRVSVYITGIDKYGREVEVYRVDNEKQLG